MLNPALDRAAWPPRPLTSRAWWLALLVLLLASLGLFAPGLVALAGNWQQPEYSHGWLIPMITLFLLWRRRPAIAAARAEGSWAGVALVALGLLVLLLSRLALMQTPEAVGFVLVAGGLGLATLGAGAMRLVWLPLAFLLFALPIPATAYYILSTKLQLLSSAIGALLLRAAGVSVYLEGNIIDLGVYRLQVAEACSGLRYLFPLSAFGFLCAWLYRGPFWARVVVLASVAPITVLTNALRIALTGLFVEHGSIALAEGFLHLFEGWVVFLLAIGLLLAAMALLARLGHRPAGLAGLLDFDRIAGEGGRPPPAARASASLKAARPLAVAALLLLAAVPAQSWAGRRSEDIPARPGLATFPLALGDWRGEERPLDPATREVLVTDDYLLADYAAPGQPAEVNLWVAYYASQIDGGRIHSPRECLPGGGWEFVRIEPVAAPVPGAPFTLNRALAAYGDRQMLMYYWYEQRGRRLTDEVWTKLSILVDALTLHRSDGALVRLSTPVLPGEPLAAAEARLAGLLRVAYPPLQPHVGL